MELKLMQPITVGTMTLKNRIMFPPLTTGYEERDGSIGPQSRAFYTRLAKGGAAFWPNVLANAVLKLTAGGGEFSVAALAERVAAEGQVADPAVKAGAEEALARLKQAAARAAE